ncbi:hypothetical protein NIES4073_03820 (plasmid) [Kalymmatonema gypsitolerans NIES-4073]|nr:hypothetical protein NIES4073_03820 [Scytonema sp. NIES-4073]
MSSLPQIEPIVARVEDEPGYQREIWEPTWNCFCCQDTGIVRPHLASKVIKGYNWNIHKLPVCTRPNCNGFTQLSAGIAHMLDQRLTATVCQQLDQLERESWEETIKMQFERIQQLAQAKSLRTRPRTPEEEEIARFRHQLSLVE